MHIYIYYVITSSHRTSEQDRFSTPKPSADFFKNQGTQLRELQNQVGTACLEESFGVRFLGGLKKPRSCTACE